MEFNALSAFIAVAENHSFSIAAERLFLSQPAVSKRIAALEEELETRLFDRVGRTIQLTEAGEALLPRARRILHEVADSRQTMRNLTGTVGGALRFATSHHIGLHRLPPLLRRFRDHYPGVTLEPQFLGSEDAIDAIEGGELELAIVTLPPTPPPQLIVATLWHDALLPVCAPDHPLAGCRDTRRLNDHPAILPGMGTYTRTLIESHLAAHGIVPRVDLSTNYLETIKMLVSVGLGWSLIPASMVDRELQPMALPQLEVERHLGSVRHRARTQSNAAMALLSLLERAA